jgi:hypothetical protein
MIEECTLGAPVVLGLALRGRWIMHAAAIERCNGHAVLVAGPSGSGKSTAARCLDRFPECRRIADDLLGLHLGGDGLLAHADYPQLKLLPGSQPAYSPLPVECIYVLNPGQAGDGFSIRTLAGLDKLLTFPAHGVATRLFPADLLARHQAFCREAAASVPVVEALYPRTAEGLRGLVDAITDTGRRSWSSPE